MNTIDDFVCLVRDEVGLLVSVDDVRVGLDEIPGWDSMHLLYLLTALERTTGRRISMPDMLSASSLAQIYELAGGR